MSTGQLSFGLAVNGSASAKTLGFSSSVGLNIGIKVDIAGGTPTIPGARPRVDKTAGVATGISWHR